MKDIKLSKNNNISDMTHIMSMTNLVGIGVKTLKLDTICSLEKEFIKLIYVKPLLHYT